MSSREIDPSFPVSRTLGSVSGAQPKLLVTLAGTRYVEPHECAVAARYEFCVDLAEQLTQYTQRKVTANPSWSLEFAVARTAQGLQQKIRSCTWDVSPEEAAWIMLVVEKNLGQV